MFQSFKAQLVILSAIAIAAGSALLGFSFVQQERGEQRQALVRLQGWAGDIAAEVSDFLKFSGEIVAYSATRVGPRAILREECDANIAILRDAVPGFGNLGILDRNGRLACSVMTPPPGFSMAQAPWFGPALAADGLHVSDAFLGPLRKRWVTVLTHPIRNEQGHTVGVATLPIDLDRFDRFSSKAGLLAGGEAGIVDGRGAVVSLSPARADAAGKPVGDEALRALVSGSVPSIASEIRDADGGGRMVGMATIPGAGWRTFVAVPAETVYADVRAQSRVRIALFAALLVLVLAPFALIAVRLLRPMEQLAAAARGASAGRQGVRAPVRGPREVRAIATQFNALLNAHETDAAALRENEARYRAMVEHAPDAIVVLDVDRGAFDDVNAVAERLFRLPRAELLARDPASLSPPVQPDGRSSAEAAAEWIERALQGETPTLEWIHRDAEGNDVPCEVRLVRMPGSRRLIRGSITDITARKRAERELMMRHAAITSAVNAIAFADEQGIITYANPAFGRMWRCAAESAIGRRADEFWETPAAAQQVMAHLQTGDSWTGELLGRRADGSLMPAAVSASLVRDADGRPLCMMGVFVDITESKTAAQRVERLTRLYAALSHTNEAVMRTAGPAALFAEICRIAVGDGGFAMAWIGMIDAATQRVVPVASFGDHVEYAAEISITIDPSTPEGNGPTGTALREGRHYVCNHFAADPHTLPWQERAHAAGYRASAAFPLRRGEQIVGVLNLYAGEPGFFDDEMVRLLDEMALDISYALDKMKAHAQREEALAALAESERRLREILETVSLVAVSLDTEGRITFCNDFLLQLTGWSREEIIGGDWFVRFIPAAGDVGAMFRQAMATGDVPAHYENEIVTRKGARRLIRWSNTVMRSGERIVGSTSLGEDVTDQRRAIDALRQSEARFRSLIESVPSIPVQGYDRHRRVFFWNTASERVYGYKASEALGRPLEDLIIAPPMRKEVIQAVDDWVEKGRPIPAGELALMRKDGSLVDVFSSHAMVRNAQGEFEMYRIDVDLSELRRAEIALRESEERFRSVVAALAEGVLLFDASGRVLMCNDAAERILGMRREAVVGKDALGADWQWSAVREDDTPFAADDNPLAITLRAGEPQRDVVMGITAQTGRRAWLEVNTRPIAAEDGGLAAVVVSFADITVRKAAEQAIRGLNFVLEHRVAERTAQLEAINRELEAFSYSISHDLRAPLRAIDGFSALVLKDEAAHLSASSRSYLDRIRASSQRMAQMIDDLLRLSRISRTELRRLPVDCSMIVRQIAGDLGHKDPARDCEWIIAPDVLAEADPGLLRSVLENLLDNAWRYTSKTPRAVIAFGARDEPDGARAYFVRDNGVGFDPAYAHKLFGAFQRLHTDREFAGHGIGLATVRRIVQRHGGRIWAEGAVGRGATFYFTLAAPATAD